MLASDEVMEPASADYDGGPPRRASIMAVCSPRPRIGKTLVARLLVEFFLADNRPVAAFDANPDDPVLSEYLPLHTKPATVATTRGQMALFDRLIVNDGIPKVIDVASDQFEALADVLRATDFANEARARAIDTAILFLAENHVRSIQAYREIMQACPDAAIVPVYNNVVEGHDPGLPYPTIGGVMPVHVAHLPSYLHGVIKRRGFSFADYLKRPAQHQSQLHDWIAQPFIAFRDLELRLSLAEFANLLRRRG